MQRVLIVITLLTLAACTDAEMGKLKALGNKADVECYSGGQLIYKGTSSGKVKSEQSSDGYFFVDAADGKTREVSGDCIITYHP